MRQIQPFLYKLYDLTQKYIVILCINVHRIISLLFLFIYFILVGAAS